MTGPYTWLNPPPGVYTMQEYLSMVEYWRDSTSVSRNQLALRPHPLTLKVFGTCGVTIRPDGYVELWRLV